MGEFAIKLAIALLILIISFIQNPKLIPQEYALISDLEKTTSKVDKFAMVLGGILIILSIVILSGISDLT